MVYLDRIPDGARGILAATADGGLIALGRAARS
jgi:hypothetical protein